MEDDHIDRLLERYLHLLHDYTSLREQLSALQTDMYQSIARANFAAERGLRFGQDYYDDRMQASARVAIAVVAPVPDPQQPQHIDDVPVFTVRGARSTSESSDGRDRKPVPDAGAGTAGEPDAATATAAAAAEEGDDDDAPGAAAQEDAGTAATITTTSAHEPKDDDKTAAAVAAGQAPLALAGPGPGPGDGDPLRWFGLLAAGSPALRRAQAAGAGAVGRVVPRLASVAAEMARVEIEVRRARKRRAKAGHARRERERDARDAREERGEVKEEVKGEEKEEEEKGEKEEGEVTAATVKATAAAEAVMV
ncbi:hypothetical protein GGR56DRAFT_687766 [Xylariaceae sp. FL0804]|nr:hypothetical protein GGR56DRAFT_687766 [Xylariaceae sp. FL0804]